MDLPTSNCYQFQSPDKWSSAETNSDGLYQWPELIWGGMSEWIRENVNITDRYIGLDHGGDGFDPHPSEYATIQFVKQVIIPLIWIYYY